jgi:hypothetical protein
MTSAAGARRFVLAFLITIISLAVGSISINLVRRNTLINNGLASNICQFFLFKHWVANNRASNALFLFGFSNVGMGTRAKLLSELVGIHAVNYGLIANSSDAMAFQALAHGLRPGDAVILEMPYWFFTIHNRIVGQESYIRSVEVSCPINGLMRLPPEYLVNFLVFQKPNEMVEGLSRLLFSGWWFDNIRMIPQFQPLQNGRFFTTAGDSDHNALSTRTPQMLARIAAAPQRPNNMRADWQSVGIAMLDWFIRYARAHNVLVHGVWPVAYTVGDINKAQIVSEIQTYYAKRGVKMLGQPADFQYPLDHFYDSNNHLTKEASVIHTQDLAKLILNSDIPRHFGLKRP